MKKPSSKHKGARGSSKRSPGNQATPKSSKPLTANKKVAGSGKRKSSKAVSVQAAKAKSAPVQPRPLAPRKPTLEEIAYRNALGQFESAVNLFNVNDFAKARGTFERLTANAAPDLAQRARVYLKICNQRLSRSSSQPRTADDHYNFGVQLANQGNLAEADEYLKKALKLAPKCDYVYYALATTSALRENAEEALGYLEKAMELNGQNRYLARNDPDFASLDEDPRFTELLYPEKPLV